MSTRHAALKRWTVTDKRWKKNVVSRGSVVTSVKRLLICAKNSWVLTLMGASVSSVTGNKIVDAAEHVCLLLGAIYTVSQKRAIFILWIAP